MTLLSMPDACVVFPMHPRSAILCHDCGEAWSIAGGFGSIDGLKLPVEVPEDHDGNASFIVGPMPLLQPNFVFALMV